MISRLLWRIAEWPIALAWYGYALFIRLTSKLTVSGTPPTGAAIFVNWHRYQGFLIPHHGTFHRFMLVSTAPALAPVARFCRLSGLKLVRGASRDRGQQALEELSDVLRLGQSVTMAVDGPAGPVFQVKRGCATLALRSGVPIVPVNYHCSRGVTLRWRWDHTYLPLPFGAIVVRYGPPLQASGTEAALIESVQRAIASHEESI